MTYEQARDIHPRHFSPIEAAAEYLNLLADDAGLAAGFRVGYRRHRTAREFSDFRRYLKNIEGR